MSFVYVLHFHNKLSHAAHYVGCTGALQQRLTAHANGAGARIMQELQLQGLTWELGGLYSCSHAAMRRHEKSLKKMHNAERYCQICHRRDQKRLYGCQTENIELVPFARDSITLCNPRADLHQVHELQDQEAEAGMAYIIDLMRKDKDALGFVPVGGNKGISMLLAKRQIILATENGQTCGYAFYTMNPSKTHVSIHQACVADEARLKGHGQQLVDYIAAKHPDAELIAKVRTDLAANHFWLAMGFAIQDEKVHETSGSLIHHYHRKAK